MAWKAVITNAGLALLNQYAQGGHTLNVLGATVASGTVAEANMRIQTALTTEKDNASIISAKVVTGGVKYKIQVTAASASVGAYTAHQIGLWAKLDSDGARTLLALAQDADNGVGIPLASVSPNFAFALFIAVSTSNTEDLTVEIDSTTFVTLGTMEDAIDEAIGDALDGVLTEDNIDDTAGSGDTDKLWSADKLVSALEGKKNTQTAVADPTASGTGVEFIDTISQNANGVITVTKKAVQDGTTSQKGIVQLEDSHASTSTTKAATPNAVKEAYDLADTANTAAGSAATTAAGKAAPSSALSLTAAAGSWSSATPPTQTITATGVTASNNIIVGIGSGITSAQYDAACAAKLVCTAQAANSITLTCYGTEPTENIPISVVILG